MKVQGLGWKVKVRCHGNKNPVSGGSWRVRCVARPGAGQHFAGVISELFTGDMWPLMLLTTAASFTRLAGPRDLLSNIFPVPVGKYFQFLAFSLNLQISEADRRFVWLFYIGTLTSPDVRQFALNPNTFYKCFNRYIAQWPGGGQRRSSGENINTTASLSA